MFRRAIPAPDTATRIRPPRRTVSSPAPSDGSRLIPTPVATTRSRWSASIWTLLARMAVDASNTVTRTLYSSTGEFTSAAAEKSAEIPLPAAGAISRFTSRADSRALLVSVSVPAMTTRPSPISVQFAGRVTLSVYVPALIRATNGPTRVAASATNSVSDRASPPSAEITNAEADSRGMAPWGVAYRWAMRRLSYPEVGLPRGGVFVLVRAAALARRPIGAPGGHPTSLLSRGQPAIASPRRQPREPLADPEVHHVAHDLDGARPEPPQEPPQGAPQGA